MRKLILGLMFFSWAWFSFEPYLRGGMARLLLQVIIFGFMAWMTMRIDIARNKKLLEEGKESYDSKRSKK